MYTITALYTMKLKIKILKSVHGGQLCYMNSSNPNFCTNCGGREHFSDLKKYLKFGISKICEKVLCII